jgi:CheY-like chemotaxis protein
MATLTRQLLAYSEGGKYVTRRMSVNELMQSILLQIKSGASAGLRIVTNLAEDLPAVEVDEMEMQMVLTSIIANAVEAISLAGCITIHAGETSLARERVTRHGIARPGRYIRITVADDGKGMDEKTLDRIFEPFFTTYFPGRGLGMAAVYGIVKNHGGWIDVDSTPGKGTAVHIGLPAVEDDALDKNLMGNQYELGGKMGTILVIDDEDLVMDIYLAMLQHLGYRALPAKNGTEAIRIARKFDGDIDLAFLDLGLPDMDGDTLYPLIKEARPEMKVIVCSGKAIDGPAQKLLEYGAQAFIEKPFSLATLSSELKKVNSASTCN